MSTLFTQLGEAVKAKIDEHAAEANDLFATKVSLAAIDHSVFATKVSLAANDSTTLATKVSLASTDQAISNLTAMHDVFIELFAPRLHVSSVLSELLAVEGRVSALEDAIPPDGDHLVDHVYLSTDLLTENGDLILAEDGTTMLQFEG